MEFTFLICSERSGSNLITRILNSHSLYCGPSPAHLFRLLCSNRMRYGNLKVDTNWDRLLDDVMALLDVRLSVWKSGWTREELDAAAAPERSLAALLRPIHEAEAKACGKRRLFIKENHAYRIAPFLIAAFPEARFVHMVRDPRDMALSWKKTSALRGGVVRATQVWTGDQQGTLDLSWQLVDADKLFLLRYEDLLARPEAELQGLCRFLGVDYEEGMLGFFQEDLTRQNAASADAWRNISRPLMRDNSGKYRAGLSEDEIRYIEGKAGDLLDAYGYARDFPAGDIAAIEAELVAGEPFDKAEYVDLPEREREQREAFSAALKRIQSADAFRAVDVLGRDTGDE